MDEKTLLQIREQFARDAQPSASVRGPSQNSFGAFILGDNSYRLIGKWVCHGWLQEHQVQNWYRSEYKGIKYVLSAVMSLNKGVSKKRALTYIDWLINRSPWAEVFVDKNAESVMELGYLVDAKHPSNFITSAMIASRFITEAYVSPDTFEGRNKLFFELLEAGVPETESFLFCHYYSGAKKDLFPVYYSPISTGHTVFSDRMFDKDYFKNFLRGFAVNPSKEFLDKGKGYQGGIFMLWGEGKGHNKFSEFMRALKPARVSLKVDLNIFRKIKEDQIQYDNMEDFLSVLRQLKGCLDA